MSRINVLWVIDHLCYDGQLHGGGRLYWNVMASFDSKRFNIIPCVLRANQTIRELFKKYPIKVRFLEKSKYDVSTLWTFLTLIRREKIHEGAYSNSRLRYTDLFPLSFLPLVIR
jgi:hypothetical protein